MNFLLRARRSVFLFFFVAAAACSASPQTHSTRLQRAPDLAPNVAKLMESLHKQTKVTTEYTQKYFVIGYPGGDVPVETGACTDVVVRAFRNAGIDLQKEVHRDMKANFSSYPSKWGLKAPDTNIDHRRVPNLMRFFERKGRALPVSTRAHDYVPGDVVTYDLNGKGMTHVAMVSDVKSADGKRYLIIHNIGRGTRLEDRLFDWEITGRYRWFGGR